MKKEDFDELIESVKEAGAILRGEKQPARVFHHPSPAVTTPPQEAFAICIETDDPELLHVLKVYQVQLLAGGSVLLNDEAGEAAIYPASNFILLELPREVEEVLSRVA
jgi:hypothetical protein